MEPKVKTILAPMANRQVVLEKEVASLQVFGDGSLKVLLVLCRKSKIPRLCYRISFAMMGPSIVFLFGGQIGKSFEKRGNNIPDLFETLIR